MLVTSGADHWRPVKVCSFGDPHGSDIWWCALKPYGFQAGGTHPTEMFSCFLVVNSTMHVLLDELV